MSSCVSCVRGGKQTHPSPSISSKINLGRRKMLGEMWDCQLGNLTAGKGSGGGGRVERQKQGFALKSGGLPTWQGDMGLGFSGEGMKFLPNG
ncbi:hypothetical protein Tco_0294917, partial [Tanacetum coccineum]